MMNKCFVGVLILNINDVYVEISMYYLTYCAYDVACDADFYRTKRQIVLRVKDSEIQR